MIYQTDRLYTREMTMDDLPALSEILQDPQVMYAYEHAFSEQEVLSWMERQLWRYREHGFGLWALVRKEDDRMIGQCGLTWQDWQDRQVLEIGYHLRQDCWHRGYAIEAARGCKDYAFQVKQAEEVFSIIRDINISSMNVAIRNGMTIRERAIRHAYGIDMPHYLFGVRCEREADK